MAPKKPKKKRHRRAAASQSGTDQSSPEESSTAEEEPTAAEEATPTGPGQGEETTDSDDDGVLGNAYAWAKKWSGTRNGQPIRGRRQTEQQMFVGREVATSWGGPGRTWTGTVVGIYNATEDYDD